MRDYLWPTGLFFASFALAAFLAGVVGAFDDWIGFVTVFLGVPLAFVALVACAAVRLALGVRCAGRLAGGPAGAVVILASPVLFVATLLMALPTLWFGVHVGDLARLAINRDRYDAIVARAEADPKALSFEVEGGVTYSVDPGPPVRVAFNPAGLLDNWSGIVFDPAGEVMLADGFDPATGAFAAPDRITELFGGDLVACRPLWDSYYKCSFT